MVQGDEWMDGLDTDRESQEEGSEEEDYSRRHHTVSLTKY